MSTASATNQSLRETSHTKISTIDTSERPPCAGCSTFLLEPFIKCKVCNPDVMLCLSCFSHGVVLEKHHSDHAYEVVNNSFPVFESCWSAAEEMRLLEALSDCGVGNWTAIAKQVRTKGAHECRNHYMKCYIINARYPLPELPRRHIVRYHPPVPFKACEDPCRPLPESHRALNLSGYLAARGDFAEEYRNSAECDIKDVQFCNGEWPTLKALKIGLIQIYQSRLAERSRRKQILSMYGLVNNSIHQIHYLSRLDTEIRLLEESLHPIMRLTHPIAYDKMFAGIALERQLAKKITKLQEYRKKGITTLSTGRLYEKLKARRRLHCVATVNFDKVLSLKNDPAALVKWLHEQASVSDRTQTSTISNNQKRMPIDISTLPGTEKLNAEEYKFCCNSRIVPEAYLKYKSTLVNAYQNTGAVKLAHARTLIKIDVNKTKRLHDFLIQHGHISDV